MKNNSKGCIAVIGMGPGMESMMTNQALQALDDAEVIVGYTVYLELLGERFAGKEMLSTPMKQETERCRLAFEEAAKGKKVAMICSGDAGIYGMASLMFEIKEELGTDAANVDINVIPGITAASSGAAVLGAPLNHDFCVISLSDLLTPWELIEKRLRAAAEGDFAIAIYNPSSKKRHDYLQKACDILLETAEPELFKSCAIFFEKLASTSSVEAGDSIAHDNCANAVTDTARIFIPMDELVDKEKEIARLEKEKAKVQKDIDFLSGKLNNQGFIAKAPAQLIEAEKAKLAKAEEKMSKIEQSIAAFSK